LNRDSPLATTVRSTRLNWLYIYWAINDGLTFEEGNIRIPPRILPYSCGLSCVDRFFSPHRGFSSSPIS
jgi:hypothetical protein